MVGCLVVASKLLPTVPVPHVDSTMSVTNSVDATRPRASTGNVVYESPSLSPRRGTLFEKIEFSPSYLSLSFSWTIQSKELYLNIKKSSRKTWFQAKERIFLQRIQFPRRWKVSNFDERSPIKNYFEGCMEKTTWLSEKKEETWSSRSREWRRRKRIFGEGLRQKFSTKNLLPTRSIPYSPRSPPDSPNDLISRKISLDLAGEWGGRRETSLNRDGSVVGVGMELSYEVAVPIRY